MSEIAKETISYEKRSDVPKEYTWAVTDLYATDEDWKKDHLKIKERIPQLENYQGKLGESAESLLAFLRLQDDISVLFDQFASYATLSSDVDTKNTTYQGFRDQMLSTYVAMSAAVSFLEPELDRKSVV